MEKNLSIECQLDKLLQFFASEGTNKAILITEIPAEFQNDKLPKLLAILERLQLVVPMSVNFGNDTNPTVFPYVLTLTPGGVLFAHNDSFKERALKQQKENKLFNFKYFTLGWDTVIAIIALIVSIIALLI